VTPAQFITAVRNIGQISVNDTTYMDAAILDEANQAILTHFLTTFVNCRSGYFLQRSQTNAVVGQNIYRLPPRAIANGLEKLELSTNLGASWYQPSILTNSQSTEYENSNTGSPYTFSHESDSIVLYPQPNDPSFIIRYFFYIRPSAIVPAVTGGTVVSKTTTTITVTAPATGISGASGTLDCVHTTGSCELALFDAPFTYAANVYTFPATVDLTRVQAGDVLRPVETTDYIPLPPEMHRTLADYTAAAILTSKGDFEKSKPLAEKAEKARAMYADLIQPRIKSSMYTWRTRNTFLRRRAGLGRWRW
jgi:hypothetical protein